MIARAFFNYGYSLVASTYRLLAKHPKELLLACLYFQASLVSAKSNPLHIPLAGLNQSPVLPMQSSFLPEAQECSALDFLHEKYDIIMNVPQLSDANNFWFCENHTQSEDYIQAVEAINLLGREGDRVELEGLSKDKIVPCESICRDASGKPIRDVDKQVSCMPGTILDSRLVCSGLEDESYHKKVYKQFETGKKYLKERELLSKAKKLEDERDAVAAKLRPVIDAHVKLVNSITAFENSVERLSNVKNAIHNEFLKIQNFYKKNFPETFDSKYFDQLKNTIDKLPSKDKYNQATHDPVLNELVLMMQKLKNLVEDKIKSTDKLTDQINELQAQAKSIDNPHYANKIIKGRNKKGFIKAKKSAISSNRNTFFISGTEHPVNLRALDREGHIKSEADLDIRPVDAQFELREHLAKHRTAILVPKKRRN